jgi:MFS family permease
LNGCLAGLLDSWESLPAGKEGMGRVGFELSMLGGLLIASLGWRAIFTINLPLCLIAIFVSLRALVDDNKRSQQRFDFVGAVSLAAALLAILYSLTEGQHIGFRTPWILALFTCGLIGFGFFIWWELHTTNPMINMQYFKVRDFSVGLLQMYLTQISRKKLLKNLKSSIKN